MATGPQQQHRIRSPLRGQGVRFGSFGVLCAAALCWIAINRGEPRILGFAGVVLLAFVVPAYLVTWRTGIELGSDRLTVVGPLTTREIPRDAVTGARVVQYRDIYGFRAGVRVVIETTSARHFLGWLSSTAGGERPSAEAVRRAASQISNWAGAESEPPPR